MLVMSSRPSSLVRSFGSVSRGLLAWVFNESRVVLFVGGVCSGTKTSEELSVDCSLFFFCQAGCG